MEKLKNMDRTKEKSGRSSGSEKKRKLINF